VNCVSEQLLPRIPKVGFVELDYFCEPWLVWRIAWISSHAFSFRTAVYLHKQHDRSLNPHGNSERESASGYGAQGRNLYLLP
jgi:hypothetical protein